MVATAASDGGGSGRCCNRRLLRCYMVGEWMSQRLNMRQRGVLPGQHVFLQTFAIGVDGFLCRVLHRMQHVQLLGHVRQHRTTVCTRVTRMGCGQCDGVGRRSGCCLGSGRDRFVCDIVGCRGGTPDGQPNVFTFLQDGVGKRGCMRFIQRMHQILHEFGGKQ